MLSAEALYDEVFQNHPELKKVQHEVRHTGQAKRNITAENRPEVFTYGIASWEHGYAPFADNFNYNIGVGLRYTLPFGTGKRFPAKNSYKAKYVRNRYRMKARQTVVDIKKEIDLAINTIQGY
ncbi:MAG: TolC family protein [Bacteroidales bacterium]|nr:TolC family protein [Bacteroidales bacterium]